MTEVVPVDEVPTGAANIDQGELLERVVIAGDLAKLRPEHRVIYYREVCKSLGLNPLTKPFAYIVLNGKLTLYATKTATDQLRGIYGISIDRIEHGEVGELYLATVYGRDRTGRQDSEVGAVSIANLKGENRANAIMKAITKAKRRLTLSLAGLGWIDETEVGSVPSAERVVVDEETGEISEPEPTITESIAAARARIEGPRAVQAGGEEAPAAGGRTTSTKRPARVAVDTSKPAEPVRYCGAKVDEWTCGLPRGHGGDYDPS